MTTLSLHYLINDKGIINHDSYNNNFLNSEQKCFIVHINNKVFIYLNLLKKKLQTNPMLYYNEVARSY